MPVLISAYGTMKSSTLFPRVRYENGHQWIISGYEKGVKQYQEFFVWELVYVSFSPGHRTDLDRYGYPPAGDMVYNDPELFGYEYVTEYEAVRRGIVPDETGIKPFAVYDPIKLIMNWGDDGDGDDNRYATVGDFQWIYDGKDMKYLKKIQYNFRKFQ